MKDSVVQNKLPKETREFYLNHKNSVDKVLDVFRESLYKDYLASIETELESCDAISNYAVKLAYQKGYQASLLKQLKLLNFDLKRLIPDHE